NRSGAMPPSSPRAASQNAPLGAVVVTRTLSATMVHCEAGSSAHSPAAEQVRQAAQAVQAAPLLPHWRAVGTCTQTVPAQQPVQLVGPHRPTVPPVPARPPIPFEPPAPASPPVAPPAPPVGPPPAPPLPD